MFHPVIITCSHKLHVSLTPKGPWLTRTKITNKSKKQSNDSGNTLDFIENTECEHTTSRTGTPSIVLVLSNRVLGRATAEKAAIQQSSSSSAPTVASMAQQEVNNHPLPPIPVLPSREQLQWLQRHEHEEQTERERGESQSSVQRTPPRSSVSVQRKAVPSTDLSESQSQDSPESLSNSLPMLRLAEADEHVNNNGEVAHRPMGYTTGSGPQLDLPFQSRPSSSQQARSADGHSHSRASSGSFVRIDQDVEQFEEEPQEQEGLQYHAFADIPKKHAQNRASHATNQSVGSSSSGGDNRVSQQLGVPRSVSGLQRPMSQHIPGSDVRGRTLSPLDANGSDHGSPRGYGRDLSSSRRSPSSRPTSYVDLLTNLPYHQQVAPGGAINHQSLQSAVGSAASLLDTKKTLDMYRANVKKTNDVAVQYEFAIYMINCSQEPDLQADINSTELVSEAKHILQRLADRAYPFAQYYLGDGYASGMFSKGKPDNDRAFPLFVAASKHQHAEAGFRAALCYEFGWGTAKSYPKAVQFYRAAAFKNHPGAATRLGMACLRNDMGLFGRDKYREGIKWLKRAQESADFQYNAAPFELGLMHLNGFGDDIFKDEAYAAQLLTQSAELGHVQANFLMGQAYENGLYGCPRDAALSVHFYNGAATQGHAEAMMALCAWYLVGADPVLDKDEREAYEWAKKSAETGEASEFTVILNHTLTYVLQVSQKQSTPSATSQRWASGVDEILWKPMSGMSEQLTKAMRRQHSGYKS